MCPWAHTHYTPGPEGWSRWWSGASQTRRALALQHTGVQPVVCPTVADQGPAPAPAQQPRMDHPQSPGPKHNGPVPPLSRDKKAAQKPVALLGGEGRLPRSDHALLSTGSLGAAPEMAEQAYCRGAGLATPNMSLAGGLFEADYF